MHVLVESMSGFEAAKRAGRGRADVWHTSSPMVMESLRASGHEVRWLDDLLEPGVPDKIGFASYKAVELLKPALKRSGENSGIPAVVRFASLPLQRVISALMYKQAVLSAWKEHCGGEGVVVGDDRLTLKDGIGLDLYDTLYAVLAARTGSKAAIIEDRLGDRKPLYARIDFMPAGERALSLLEISAGQLAHRFMLLMRNRPVGLSGKGPVVHVLRENELIREMLPVFLARGATVRYEPPLAPGKEAGGAPRGLPGEREVSEAIEKGLAALKLKIPVRPVAEITAGILSRASVNWAPAAEAARKRVDSWLDGKKDHVLLSNTLSGPAEIVLGEICRERRVPVFIAEHGVSAGLSRFHEPVRPYSEAALSDVYLTCSPNTTKFYEEEPSTSGKPVTVGLAKMIRTSPQKTLRRAVVRRRLKAGRERVVAYITRACQNNLRFLPHSQEDRDVHRMERLMVREVMPNVRGVPVIKFYNTRRHIDPHPFTHEFRAKPPVRTLQEGDFRFLRAGVDVIITQSPMSTLGWVMGAGVPVFYLEEPALRLRPGVREMFENSVFFFSTSEPGWHERLLASLNRSDREIAEDWWKMSGARKKFLDWCVFGPENAARNAAAVVLETAGGQAARRSEVRRDELTKES